MRASDIIQQAEQSQRATAFVSWAACLDTRITDDPVGTFRAKGWDVYHDLVSTKSIMSSTDAGIAGQPLSMPFVAEVEREAVTGQIVGAVRVPLSSAARIQAGVIEAQVVGEGAEKPIARFDFDVSSDLPTKIVGQIVCSAEWLRAVDQRTQTAVSRQLVSATATKTDAEFIAALTAGSPITGGVGELLAAISGGAPAKPYLIGSYAELVPLAGTLRDLRDFGVGILVTPAAAGKLIALDASGLMIADDGGATVQTATHATVAIEVDSEEVTLSLWERNLAAVRAERFVRYALRSGAVAFAEVSE